MAERQRGLSKTASMPMMKAPAPPPYSTSNSRQSSARMSVNASNSLGSSSSGGLFSSWRNRHSKREQANEQLASLDGKELREAIWKQQQHDQQALAPVKPLRVLRYTPPAGSSADADADTDDDASSASGSVRGLPSTPHTYDQDMSHHRPSPGRRATPTPSPYDNGSHTTSRLSFTLSRLSLSSSASATIADYKAKKYDVEWKRDQDCLDCQVCHLAFTKWSRRRHHCRVCGEIVCEDCSPDQVHITGRFARPKRACTACFSLLEAVMYLSTATDSGKNPVQLFVEPAPGQDWVNKTPSSSQRREYIATASSTASSHDRLAEIQRVTAAGKKARRQGDNRQCVISAAWLRAWLAFTRERDDNEDHLASSFHQRSRIAQGAAAPGAIDNLSLLMVKQGKLVPRDGLERCETSHEQLTQARGDYQVIPVEIWDVFHRYYGGGPLIEVVSDNDWVVDVTTVLRSARAVATNPSAAPGATAPPLTVEEKVIERALTERHDPYNILVDVSTASSSTTSQREDLSRSHAATPFTPWASSSSVAAAAPSSRPPPIARSVSDTLSTSRMAGVPKTPSNINTTSRKPEPPRGDGGVVPRPRSHQPQPPRREPEREPDSDVHRKQPPAKYYVPGPRDQPQATESEPSAARAASAFALAMKESRLRQQRAIIGSARGVGNGEY